MTREAFHEDCCIQRSKKGVWGGAPDHAVDCAVDRDVAGKLSGAGVEPAPVGDAVTGVECGGPGDGSGSGGGPDAGVPFWDHQPGG